MEGPKMIALSRNQRRVLKVLKSGGIIYYSWRKSYSYRLLDQARNPIMNVHVKTFKALSNKSLIIQTEKGIWAQAEG